MARLWMSFSGAACLAAIPLLAAGDTLRVSDDAYTDPLARNTNFGRVLSLKINTRGSKATRAFLRFDLSVLPPSAAISRATLRLWAASVRDGGPLDLRLVLAPWVETTIKDVNAPSVGASIGGVTLTVGGRWVTADITSTVKAWVDGSTPNNGLAIVGATADAISATIGAKEGVHSSDIEVFVASSGPSGPPGPPGVPGPPGTQGPQVPTVLRACRAPPGPGCFASWTSTGKP
jgi:hypothetical protein